MRVILDTNVLVSALLVKGSAPARIVDALPEILEWEELSPR